MAPSAWSAPRAALIGLWTRVSHRMAPPLLRRSHAGGDAWIDSLGGKGPLAYGGAHHVQGLEAGAVRLCCGPEPGKLNHHTAAWTEQHGARSAVSSGPCTSRSE